MNLPLVETGALVVAWSARGGARSPAIRDLAQRNGTTDARIVGADELVEREPHLSTATHAARWLIPGEAIIDPWSAPLGYMTQAIRHGAPLVTRAPCTAIVRNRTRLAARHRGRRVRGADRGERRRPLRRRDRAAARHRSRLHHPPAQGPVHRLRQAGATISSAPSSSRSRPSAPRACSSPRPSSATCCSGRPPRTSRTARTPPATRRCCARSAPRASDPAGSRRPDGHRHASPDCGRRPSTATIVLAVDDRQSWITVAGIRSTGLSAALGLGEWAAENGSRLLGEARAAPPDDDLDWPRDAQPRASSPRPYEQPGRSADRLPLRVGDRAQGSAPRSRAACRRHARRTEAPDAGHDGPLPGIRLHSGGASLAPQLFRGAVV